MIIRRAALLSLAALSFACAPVADRSETAGAAITPSVERQFADDLSRRTFNYFWETTDPDTCLAPDRWPSAPFSSIAAVGFAITAYGIGAERGYVTRQQAAERTLGCLRYFHEAPQGPAERGVTGYKGFFYHFLSLEDGTRHKTTELSSVDTSLLFAGVLFAQSYFDRDTAAEAAIRATADRLYRRADWTFFLRGPNDNQATNLEGSAGIAMGWKPESGFGAHDWVGYNEGMLVYVLALGSPTHPVGREAWDSGWAARLDEAWGEYYGYEHLNFEPLFGHQYSHVWIDFRGIRDDFMRAKGIDYFENSRRATLAQRAYASDNPAGWVGYGEHIWGLTASDGPGYSNGVYEVGGKPRLFMGYSARGASRIRVRDDGTIAPTAAGGSIPFAPEIALPALMAMKRKYGRRLYTEYGFKDAFNASFTFTDYGSRSGEVSRDIGWIARDHLGIDQGPILAMLENHRSELVWQVMRKNPYIRNGLRGIGFSGGWLTDEPPGGPSVTDGRACGGDPLLTLYPDAGHDAWTRTYADPELYDWLLRHVRDNP
ncbi:MAG: glucoamylase family protein [Pseudomonadota bacterium]